MEYIASVWHYFCIVAGCVAVVMALAILYHLWNMRDDEKRKIARCPHRVDDLYDKHNEIITVMTILGEKVNSYGDKVVEVEKKVAEVQAHIIVLEDRIRTAELSLTHRATTTKVTK